MILHHENWRDEAQAWQIAKLTNLSGLFAQLKYEGHPCLWYFLLMPFAKLGLPFGTINLISLGFMAVAFFFVLERAPFAYPLRVLIGFSGFFLYYYPVIARSYALVPLLLALLALDYPERMEKPLPYGILLALLTQTHIYMLGLSAGLSFFWFLEMAWDFWHDAKEKTWKKVLWRQRLLGLSLNLWSGLFLLWELFGSTDKNSGIQIHISSSLSSNLHRISVAAQWAAGFAVGSGISDEKWKILVIIILLCFLFLFCWSCKEGLILAAAVGSQILMFTYVYLPSEQKAMLLMHELIFVLWVILEKKKEKGEITQWRRKCRLGARIGAEVVLALLCLLSLDGHKAAMKTDLQAAYAAGKDAAAFLENEVPEDSLIVTAGDVPAYAAAAYAPDRSIWYPLSESPITFSVWDESREETISYEEMVNRIRAAYPEVRSFWLLTGGQNNVEGLEEALADDVPVFQEDAMLSEESIRIYHIEF